MLSSAVRRGMVQTSLKGPPSGSTPVDAWKAAVTANGGNYTVGDVAALTVFMTSAIANGYWSKFKRLNLFAGTDLAACLVPLIATLGTPTDTNQNFVGADYTRATGLKGDGGSKSLNTGAKASDLTLNDVHMSVYNRSSAGSNGVHIAAFILATSNYFHLYGPYGDGNIYNDVYGQAGGRLQVAVGGTPYGHIIGNRAAVNDHKIYRNGAQLATNATASGTPPVADIWIFSERGLALFSANSLGAYSLGDGLTGAQAAAFYTDLQTYATAQGRQV